MKQKVFLVPGGPGMDAGYFRFAVNILPSATRNKFVFEFADVSTYSAGFEIEEMSNQLWKQIQDLPSGTIVICHSFGGCLYLETVRRYGLPFNVSYANLACVPLDNSWLADFHTAHNQSSQIRDISGKLPNLATSECVDQDCKKYFKCWIPLYFSKEYQEFGDSCFDATNFNGAQFSESQKGYFKAFKLGHIVDSKIRFIWSQGDNIVPPLHFQKFVDSQASKRICKVVHGSHFFLVEQFGSFLENL